MDAADEDLTIWGIGPVVKYYIDLGNDKLIDLKAGLEYNSVTPPFKDADETTRLNYMVGADFILMMNDNLGLNAGLGYTMGGESETDGTGNEDSYTQMTIGIGVNVFI